MPRGARAGWGVVLATGLVLMLAACVDLFHSTNFETACDVDVDAAACETPEGSAATSCPDPSAPGDVCAVTALADSGRD